MSSFLYEFLEQGQGLFDGFQADAVAQPEIFRAAEAVAGNDQKIQGFGLFREGCAVATRGFYEQVKSAVGLCHFVTHGGKAVVQGAAVFVISFQVRAQVGAAGDDLLPQTGGADVSCAARCAADGSVQIFAVGGLTGYIDVADTLTGSDSVPE